MRIVRTRTGSIYELDGDKKQIRAVKRSATHRIEEGWKPYENVDLKVGRSMIVYWGTGRDEYSENAIQVGGSEYSTTRGTILRTTQTSPVVSIEEQP